MSESVPKKIRQLTQVRIQAISELAAYLGHADAAMVSDHAEWSRSLIRALADLSRTAKETEVELTQDAIQSKSLTVTEVAKAAKLTRAAVYLRVEKDS
jgi:DNA-binding NtrC family response regulator